MPRVIAGAGAEQRVQEALHTLEIVCGGVRGRQAQEHHLAGGVAHEVVPVDLPVRESLEVQRLQRLEDGHHRPGPVSVAGPDGRHLDPRLHRPARCRDGPRRQLRVPGKRWSVDRSMEHRQALTLGVERTSRLRTQGLDRPIPSANPDRCAAGRAPRGLSWMLTAGARHRAPKRRTWAWTREPGNRFR